MRFHKKNSRQKFKEQEKEETHSSFQAQKIRKSVKNFYMILKRPVSVSRAMNKSLKIANHKIHKVKNT